MPYIGKQLVRGQNRKLDDISSGFNGSQTTFTLQVASQNVTVGSALQLWISVGGVIQNPLTDFTIAGNQITFTTAPAASLDFFGVIQGDVTDTNTPGDATVTTSKLSTGLTVNLADGSAATSSLQLGGTDSGLFSSAADKVNVTTGGVERLEIGNSEVVFNDPSNDVDFRVESNGETHMLFVDAGNDRVGMGTSSPSAPLDVRGTGLISRFESDSSSAILRIANTETNDCNFIYTSDLAISVGGSERMRIDSSGRLLLGASSSVAPNRLFQIAGSNMSICANTANTDGVTVDYIKSRNTSYGSNTIVQSGDTIAKIQFRGDDGSDYLSQAAQIAAEVDGTPGSNDMPGRLVFSTTADGASTPTERMRIDSSGNVAIGPNTQGHGLLTLSQSASAAFNALVIQQGNTGSADSDGLHIGIDSAVDAYITHKESRALAFGTANTERMRIDSSGNVGIGTTSPNNNLHINQADSGNNFVQFTNSTTGTGSSDGGLVGINTAEQLLLWNYESDDVLIGTNNTERMRIDNAGNILLACTSGAGDSDPGVKVGQADNPWLRIVGNESTGTNFFLSGYNTNATNNGYRFYVMFNGGIANFSSNNSNLSDEREKKNIVSLDSKWDKVKSWELKKFHYNEDADTDDLRYGVIAQQVEEHCPEVLTDWIKQKAEDAVLDDDGNVVTPAVSEITRKGVKEQQMMWMAIKALQEAQARIETLEAKVAALEAE